MTNEEKQEASRKAKLATEQMKHAAKNTARATKAVAEPAFNGAVDVAEDVMDDVSDAASRISPSALGRISGDAGVGFLALSVTLYAGAIAINKFRSAFAGRDTVIR